MNPHFQRPDRVAPRLAIAVGALCLLVSPQFARGGEPTSIDWRDDYAAALENARAANRMLWIQFTGPWCPNCTRMERDSFPSPTIVEHSQRSFVPVKLRSDLNAELVAAFNLTAIPATVIVAPNRDILSFHQGYLGPDELDGLLRDCLARSCLKPAEERPAVSTEEATALEGEKKTEDPAEGAAAAVLGYCPVSLVDERKLVKGRIERPVVHEGRAYYFSSREASERFRQEPTRYVPWSGGTCPVTQLEKGLTKPGDPRWGILYAGRLFLCASEQSRRRFIANPGRFAEQPSATAELSDVAARPKREVAR